jgi:endonuclease/exonuclease/phosphatase (EEP) superfamily protein YafD
VELVFLPQVFVIVLLWLAVFALLVRRSWAMIDRNGRSLVAIHVVLLGMFILNSLVPLLEFAYINQPAPAAASSSKIRVAFFNKLYTNYDYEAISQEIIDLKPDVIGFAEFRSEDRQKIAALKDYKYFLVSKCEECNRPNNESGLFSLLPMRDPKVFNPEPKDSPIVRATLIGGKGAMDVVVVHPNSPLIPGDLALRNQEIHYLTDLLLEDTKKPTIVMGDFNTTPWSPTYRQFLSRVPHLTDAAAGTGLHSTWGYWPLSIHIDHILLSKDLKPANFEVESGYGSDHNLIYTDVEL